MYRLLVRDLLDDSWSVGIKHLRELRGWHVLDGDGGIVVEHML